MYGVLHDTKDVMKEKYILGAELTGKYDFPKIPRVTCHVDNLKSVPFDKAKIEKNPKKSMAHFFCYDNVFQRIWNNCEQHIDYLANFAYVCTPDFSAWSDMPLALQIYNVYRNRALAYFLYENGINIIPTVSWTDETSYDWIFDGLPDNSTLAVSTNGCFSPTGKECFKRGFYEMLERLDPRNVIIVGREIPLNTDVEITYMESFGQQMEKKLKGR